MKNSVIDRIRNFSKRTYGQWVYQFLFVVLVIIILTSFVLLFFLSSIDDNLNEINSNLVSYLKMDIDSRLYDIQHYVASFSASYLTGVLPSGFDDESLRHSADEISDVLRGYTHVNSLISHMHVYYPGLDLIAGDIGAFKTGHYYALINKNKTDGIDDYLQIISSNHPGYHLAWRDGEPLLCFIRPLRTKNYTFGFLVVEIDSLQLLASVKKSDIDTTRFQNEFAVIYDGTIIATTTRNVIGQPVSKILSSIPKTKNLVTLHSNLNKLEYAGLFKSITLDHQMFLSRVLVFLLIIFMILFGVLSSIFFARRNWKPVQQIMDKLDLTENEYGKGIEQLDKKIDKILNDYSYSEEKLNEYTSIVSSVFLSNVLSGKKKNEEEIVSFASTFGLDFSLPCFALVTIIGNNLEKIIEEIQKHADFDSTLISCIQDDKLYLYIGLDENEDQLTIRTFIEQYIDASSYFVGIGSVYDSLKCIVYSAREGYSLYKPGLCGIHCYLGEPLSNASNDDSSKIFEFFFTNIKEKRYPQAISSIKDVFDRYFGTDEISSDELQMKFHGLKERILSVSKNIPDSAFDYTSKETLMDCLIQILGSLNDSGDHDLPQKAMNIIKKKYSDSQFGLFSLSQELDVSNSYLSTKFKNEFGIGIAKCIVNLRMQEAKRLIMTTDMPIREIALSVGFSSDIAFLRAFKRVESTTPTNMRRNKMEG